MIPIVTPSEMAAVDAAATEPESVLIERAGTAVAWAARRLLGGVYGMRIAVLAGPGNNGADGRVAARRLADWGARVSVLAPDGTPARDIDLLIDAAYGTGLSRPYHPPHVVAPVLAVDIPSGVNGLTGQVPGEALAARMTVTFQALKPGLLFPPGSALVGSISVADIGLDVSAATAHLVEPSDVARWLPERAVDAHKWQSACWVIGGSPGMSGAANLAAAAAARAGAGYVRLSVPGGTAEAGPIEAVGHPLAASRWAEALGDADRFGALVLGPGLGTAPGVAVDVRDAVSIPTPIVLDGDGLTVLGEELTPLSKRATPAILTPHDGEFERLTGQRPGADRIAAARHLAAASSSVVLLKGPATVVAQPDGAVLVSTTGDERLATAGSGDVLAGIIGALLAQGVPPFRAAAMGAFLHGRAATAGVARGMVASDLVAAIPEVLHEAHLG